RHTRFSRDWSSDVCSSDLMGAAVAQTVEMPPDAATKPVQERTETDPGLGATDDRPGPAESVGQEPTSGAIVIPEFELVDRNQDEIGRASCRARQEAEEVVR